MQLIYPSLIEARGLVLVSPTHNYNVTAWMKAFLDRLYCFYDYTNDNPRAWSSRLAGEERKAVIVSIGEQILKEEAIGLTLEAMRFPIQDLGYEVIDELPVIGLFEKGKVKQQLPTLHNAEKLGSRLARLLQDSRI